MSLIFPSPQEVIEEDTPDASTINFNFLSLPGESGDVSAAELSARSGGEEIFVTTAARSPVVPSPLIKSVSFAPDTTDNETDNEMIGGGGAAGSEDEREREAKLQRRAERRRKRKEAAERAEREQEERDREAFKDPLDDYVNKVMAELDKCECLCLCLPGMENVWLDQ